MHSQEVSRDAHLRVAPGYSSADRRAIGMQTPPAPPCTGLNHLILVLIIYEHLRFVCLKNRTIFLRCQPEEERQGKSQATCLRSLEVDDQLELCGLLRRRATTLYGQAKGAHRGMAHRCVDIEERGAV